MQTSITHTADHNQRNTNIFCRLGTSLPLTHRTQPIKETVQQQYSLAQTNLRLNIMSADQNPHLALNSTVGSLQNI